MDKDTIAGIVQARNQGYQDDEIVSVLISGGKIPQEVFGLNYTPKEIIDTIIESAEPSMMEQLQRQLGLAARAVAPVAIPAAAGFVTGGPFGAGVMTTGAVMGPAIMDPLVNLYNRATGSNVTPPGQSVEELMTKAGLPEPQSKPESVAQAGSRGMVGGAGSARAMAEMAPYIQSQTARQVVSQMAQQPVAQMSAGTAASLAPSAAQQYAGASPAEQMLLALGAGTVAPGGTKMPLTERVLQAGGSIVKPFTQAGREVIAGNVLQRLATNPERARQMMAESQPLVPGVQPTTAAVARDPGLAASETTMRSLDTSGQFGARLSQNQTALLRRFNRLAGDETMLQNAINRRNAATKQMRDEAFAQAPQMSADEFATIRSGNVDIVVDGILQGDTGARQSVKSAMNWVKDRLQQDATDPKRLYRVRQDIADAMMGKFNQDNPALLLAKGELGTVRNAVDNLLEQLAPGYGDYMKRFSQMSQPIDQMRTLQSMREKVTTGVPDVVTLDTPISPAKFRNQMVSMQDQISKMTPQTQKRLNDILDELNRSQAAVAPGVKQPGSDTFKNMSMANMIGKIFSESMASNTTLRTITRPLDFLYRLPDEALQRLMIEAAIDPKLGAQLMSKANMMKIDPLAKSLKQKAIDIGYGTYVGMSQGE